MLRIVEQTHGEQVKMYMKCSKKELIEMLIENGRILNLQRPRAEILNPDLKLQWPVFGNSGNPITYSNKNNMDWNPTIVTV